MPEFTYGGRDRTPGIKAVVETYENEFLWGPYEAQYISGLTISGAARDVGNTGSTHILRAGLILGQVTASKKLMQWDASATDGSEYIWGILKESRSMLSNNTNQDRLAGLIVVGGGLLAKNIIVPGTVAPGLVGNALEFIARQQLRTRFMLNDTYMNSRSEIQIHTVSATEQGSGIVLANEDSHRAYHNTGGTIAMTLPTVALKGLVYEFYAQTTTTDAITVGSGSSNIIVPGSAATNSLVVDAEINRLEGDGTNWVVKTL